MKKQLLLFILSLLPMLAMANVTYTYNSITKTLTIQGSGAMPNYSSPSSAPWYSYREDIKTVIIKKGVTYIGDCVFDGCSGLTSVTIGNSVISISKYAFSGCSSLTSVEFHCPQIDSWFKGCTSIKEVIIGNEVTSIGDQAFKDCSGLSSVTIPNGVTSIGYNAFYGCSGLSSVEFHCAQIGSWFRTNKSIKEIVIGNEVTSIGSDAFVWCSGLTSVTIGNSVTRIGEDAFCGCSGITSVTMPNSVTSIGSRAFYGCSGLQNVIVPDIAAWCGISFHDVNSANPLYYAHHIYSDENTEIKDLVIPDGVTSIGNYAFEMCSGLTSITIPNSVTSIGSGAFWRCSGLTSVIIGNSVTSIGSSAFDSCKGLISVTIPNSVTSIGSWAFDGCSGLQKVYSKVEDVFGINNITFGDATYNNAKLYVPIGKKATYQSTDGWKNFANIEEFDVTNIAAQYRSKDARIVDVYKLNGQRSDDVRRGVNIIRMSDGTTRKVVVK